MRTIIAFACAFPILILSQTPRAVVGSGCNTPQFGNEPITAAVGISPRSIASGDFNGDGAIDFAVANYGTGQGSTNGGISILINAGMGGFSNANNLPGGVNPRGIVAGDFNNDGKADLSFLHYANGSCCISTFVTVLLGDGAGNFSSAGAATAVGNDGSSLVANDFNNDGKLDLAATVAGSPFGAVSILLGNGTGSFSPATTFTAGGNAVSVAAGDVNNDGKIDLVTANLNSSNISVMMGDGAGAFGGPNKFDSAPDNPRFVALGDVNNDLRLDVVTADTSNNVSVFLGNGGGTFGTPTSFGLGTTPSSVLIKDLTGDGRADLATANSPASTVSVLRGNGSGGFSWLTSYAVGSSPLFITSADVNGDNKPDLATTNAGSNNISVLLGDGFGAARTFNVGQVPLSVASGDLNGDGAADLMVANSGQSSISVLLGDSTGSFGADVKYPAGFNPKHLITGDFNLDGKLDLAVANGTCCADAKSVSVLFGNGSGGFASPVSFDAGVNAFSIASGDFNNDGKQDLATVNNADNNVSILRGNGSGSFAAPLNVSLPGSPTDLATGDFNGDGKTDLAVVMGTLSILIGNGAAGFSLSPPIVLSGAVNIAVGDVNGDGIVDIATANSTGTVSVLLGNAMGDFGSLRTIPVTAAQDVAIDDVNSDGKADLVVTSGPSSTVVRVLLGDGAGDFGGPISFGAGSGPFTVMTGDLNGDGRPDIVTTLSESISVLINSCTAPPLVPPMITVTDASISEGNAGQVSLSFPVTLSGPSLQTVTVSYYTVNGTAMSGEDYQSNSGRITFAPGTVAQTIAVSVFGDTTLEADEQFGLILNNSLNGTIADGQAIGTVLDDDTIRLVLESSGPTGNQAAALDSLLLVRDPFHVSSIAQWLDLGADLNTRVTVFALNLTLAPGEPVSAVLVNLIDSNNQSHDVAAEDVRAVPNSSFTQVTFRLPDNLPAGTCLVAIKAHGQISNTGSIRIAPQ